MSKSCFRFAFHSALVAVALIAAAISPALGAPLSAADRPFSYTITANGTQSVRTYPDQAFDWTVTTTGTETYSETGLLGQMPVSISGYQQSATYYLNAPDGSTITTWDILPFSTTSYAYGRDDGTYIDSANNRLVVKVYSGGYTRCTYWSWSWGSSYCTGEWVTVSGYYSAVYRINGTTELTATVTSTVSGSDIVNATQGEKWVANVSLAAPPAEHGGTVAVNSRTLASSNPNVSLRKVVWASIDIYASTSYSETVSQPWAATETGSASVNWAEGNKPVISSALVAPDNDTVWSVADDSSYVETWMEGNQLYARAANTPPVATGDSYSNMEGGSLSVAAPGVLGNDTDDEGTSLTAVLVTGPLHGVVTLSTDGSFTYTPAAGYNGSDSFTYTANDGGLDSNVVTVVVNTTNQAPIVAAPPGQAASEGGAKIFDLGSFTDAGAYDYPWTLDLDWGDSTSHEVFQTDATGPLGNRSHSYADNGAYTVTVKVTDKDGGVGKASFLVVVANVAPTATFNAPAVVDEGRPIELSLTGAADPSPVDTAAGFTIAFDCGLGEGYGAFSATSSAICPTTDNGVRTVRGKVKDKNDGVTEYTKAVTINNVAPVAAAAADQTANEGVAKSFAIGSFTDPGTDSPWAVDVDWGDGTTHTAFNLISAGTIASKSHTYADNGTYTVTVRVTDKDGVSDSKSFNIAVANVVPVTDAGPDGTIDEGGTFTGTGSFTDSGADAWTATVDYGDGTGVQPLALAGKGFSLSHRYLDDGSYSVAVTVRDDDGGVGSDTLVVTVRNVAPTVSAGSDVAIFSGQSLVVNASFSDPSPVDTHTARIDWGDGSAVETVPVVQGQGSGMLTASRVFFDPSRRYIVTVTITDDSGGAGSDSLQLEVKMLPVAIDIKPGPGPNSINLGSNGNIPVAVLSGSYEGVTLDATAIELGSVRFEGAAALSIGLGAQDVNKDGRIDKVFHFKTDEATGLTATSIQGKLTGKTSGNIWFEATDSVRPVPEQKANQGETKPQAQNQTSR